MKKRGMKKRVLAALMTACMVVGSVPGVSLADVSGEPSGTLTPAAKKYNFNGTTSTVADPDIELNKKAVYNADTNDYTITLSAKAKEKVETKKTHVVFLLDASGSMSWCTETDPKEIGHYHVGGVDAHCTKIKADPSKTKSRWQIATNAIKLMTDNLGRDEITYNYTYFSSDTGESVAEIPYSDHTKITGGTELTSGVNYALGKFSGDTKDTDQILIIVADGETDDTKDVWIEDGWLPIIGNYGHWEKQTYYPKKELENFQSATNNGKVYTVGFTFSSEGFKSLANGSDYNFNATDEDSLNVALNQISQKIKTGITDPLGSNVELVGGITVDGSEVVANYDSEKNEITWNDPNGLDKNGVSLTYRVKVKDTSNAGSVYLNGDAVLSYTAGSANHTVQFPKPSITGAKLTVQYTEQGTGKVVKTGNDWIGFTGGDVSFKKITEIPETILVNGTTYYVVSSDPEAIPTPTEAINYIVNVQVSKDKPNQAIYSVIYDAKGGTWKGYEAQEPYTLNPERSMLTRAGMNYGDMIEILDGKDAPERSGYVFKGWQLGEDKLVDRVPVGYAADSSHEVHLSAIWEEDGSTPAETVTYVVNKHYFDTDTEKSVYDESVDVNQTAEKGSLISSKVAGLMTIQNYYYTDYLYDHATVTVESTTTEYTEASVFQPGRNIIDLYYYRDSWNKNDGSETGGDEIPDNKQVLVKFGNKDGNGTVTDDENAGNNGTVQVYTLEEEQKNVIPSLEGVKVEAAEGHEFKKWTKGNNSASVKPDIAWMVKGGDEIDFWAWFDAKEPESPELPTDDELKALIDIALIHTGSNADHNNKSYPLLPDSYTVASASDARAIVTVNADAYVEAYNDEYGTHTLVGRPAATLTFKYGGSAWELADGTVPVTFTVKCTENNPEKPDLPKYDDLKKLFGETINVTCETDEQHAPQSFGLMAGTYSVTRDKEDDNEAVVTVFAKDYIKAYGDGKHTNAGDDAATVKLVYDGEDGKWYSENQEIVINFKAKCEKAPETPEKQYTEIKFVVVNGTFTENGQTELTKTFEVGTKLTLADIPASKGKSSSYSDQTWDKLPVGYVVGKDGTTFTITYKWRASGSDSDDSDYDYGTSTRGKATNAAGKSGRWILEGGEFTEDNGRLPSNEYLKIGDTIYGFYTYGFAIDFDRPEYYTDAAIQAKGGYRDATGTWRLNGWWFCYDDGTFPHDEWVYLTWNGRSDWYYFDVDGWMEDGWLYRNNNWYYLHTQYDNTRGRMYTGWHEIDGKWYYFNTASDKGTLGAMLANTTTPDGYQVDANGAWIR